MNTLGRLSHCPPALNLSISHLGYKTQLWDWEHAQIIIMADDPTDYSDYRTCAIAIPDDEKNGDLALEHIAGGIGGAADGSPQVVANAILANLDQLWEIGAVSFPFTVTFIKTLY